MYHVLLSSRRLLALASLLLNLQNSAASLGNCTLGRATSGHGHCLLDETLNDHDQIVSYLKSIQLHRFLRVRRVEAKHRLRQPVGQRNCEGEAVVALDYDVVVLLVILEHKFLVYDVVILVYWLHCSARRLVWQVQDHLLLAVQGQGNLFYILYRLLSMQMHRAI